MDVTTKDFFAYIFAVAVVHLIEVEFTTVTELHSLPSIITLAGLIKPVPVIVIFVPPR